MSFSVDHSKAPKARYMAPEGEYEALITSARENITRSGTKFLDLRLFIRQDVYQPGQGETLQYAVWRRKSPLPGDPEGFPAGVIQNISRCAGLDNGATFASMAEWLKALSGLNVRVTVRHEEYLGETRAQVAYMSPSKAPYEPGATAVLSDELPF